tara:strand:+ start:892 stop:1083 length:192 start_codon:yes stop_codon:yes gene_type:complete
MNQFKIEEVGIENDSRKTLIEKDKFINEMKNGLGSVIKENAGIIRHKKPSFFKRIMKRIMDTF